MVEASRPLIYAHRGVAVSCSENSPCSIAAAVAQGADGIEVDIRMTEDEQLILCHDGEVYGTEVARSPLDRLRELARVHEGEIYTMFPALLIAGHLRINLELKADSAGRDAAVVALVVGALRTYFSESELIERFEVSSFEPRVLELCRDVAPYLPRFLLCDRYQRMRRRTKRALALGCDGINIERRRATRRNIDRARLLSLSVGVWTEDSSRRAKRLSYRAVSHIITNRVEDLVQGIVPRP